MPTYSFQCLTCDGRAFDLTRPFSQSAEAAECPQCGRTDTRRVHSFSSRSQIPKLTARVAAAEATPRPDPGPGPAAPTSS